MKMTGSGKIQIGYDPWLQSPYVEHFRQVASIASLRRTIDMIRQWHKKRLPAALSSNTAFRGGHGSIDIMRNKQAKELPHLFPLVLCVPLSPRFKTILELGRFRCDVPVLVTVMCPNLASATTGRRRKPRRMDDRKTVREKTSGFLC